MSNNTKRMIGNKLGAKNVSVIFVIIATLIITPIAIVALANTQSAFGNTIVAAKPCKIVEITNPPDGTLSITLHPDTLFKGYAKYGYLHDGVCQGTDVPGSKLTWDVDGAGLNVVGTGKSIPESEFEKVLPEGRWNCMGTDVWLTATFPDGTQKIDTIHIRGGQCPYP